MICPECGGKGAVIRYRETDRDENSVTVRKFEDICPACHGSGSKPQTNADRIRAMSDEELVEIIGCTKRFDKRAACFDRTCLDCILDWLRQPVKDGGSDG